MAPLGGLRAGIAAGGEAQILAGGHDPDAAGGFLAGQPGRAAVGGTIVHHHDLPSGRAGRMFQRFEAGLGQRELVQDRDDDGHVRATSALAAGHGNQPPWPVSGQFDTSLGEIKDSTS